MKIIFFTRLFYPHVGGVEKHVFELSRELQKRGHRIVIIAEQDDEDELLMEEYKNLQIWRIPLQEIKKNRKLVIWKYLWKHRQLFLYSDIIHIHDIFFWYLPFSFLFPHKPVFITYHGYESYPIRTKAILMHKLAEWLTNGNICIGDYLTKWYGTKADYLSYGATDIAKQKPFTSKLSAVFWGRLDKQTSILVYSHVFKLLKKDYPSFTFTVVGEGEQKRFLSDDIKIFAFQHNITPYLMSSHYAFVSRYLSILEAMIAKRLVFAVYDNPVKEDYLRLSPFAKFIVIEKNPKKLAERVIYFIKHPREEKERVDLAYQWAVKQTWRNVAEMYMRLWTNQ